MMSLLALIAAAALSPPVHSLAAEPISISQFLDSSADLKPSARLLALDGKRVRLVGFMAQMEMPPSGGFYLCPRPVSADESGAGIGDLPVETVFVVMKSAGGGEVPYRPGPLEVTGVLQIRNHADQDGRVTAFQITLDRPRARKRPARTQTQGDDR